MFRSKRTVISLVAAAAMLVAACGSDDDEATTTTEAESSPSSTAGEGTPSTDAPSSTTEAELPDDLPSITLDVAFNLAEASNTGTALIAVAEAVSERTGGRLTLNLFPAAQLGPVQETVEQAALGADVISSGEPSLFAGFGAPDMSILTGPFLLDNIDEWTNILESDLYDEWSEQLASQGLRLLDLGWYVGERHILGTSAYPTPDDLNGVKIRIPPLPAWTTTFEALQATPVTVDLAEVYTAVQQGVVDSLEAPLSTLRDNLFYEVADQVTLTAHFRQFQGFVMSEDVFQSLPEEYQTVLIEEFAAGGQAVTAAEFEGQDQARADLEAEGVQFTEADREAYRAATESFYTSFPEWSDGLYERVNAAKSGG